VKLVGIETSCFYGKYIRGISTECVLALIGSQWPELKSSILMAHGRIEFGLQLHRRPG
jgi:hypothetical protein